MRNFLAGLRDYLRAGHLLFKARLWPLFLVPGILSLCCLPVALLVGAFYFDDLTVYLHERWVPDALQSPAMEVLLWVLVAVLAFATGMALYRNIVMILYSPLLDFLSESVEKRIEPGRSEPEAPAFCWKSTLKSAARGTGMSMLTLLLAAVGALVCLAIGLIPLIGSLGAVIGLLGVTSFVAGLGFVDPVLSRRGLTVSTSLRVGWGCRGRLIGHGAVFLLLQLVPFVGWFLAPSLGVVAGTVGGVEVLSGVRGKPQ